MEKEKMSKAIDHYLLISNDPNITLEDVYNWNKKTLKENLIKKRLSNAIVENLVQSFEKEIKSFLK